MLQRAVLYALAFSGGLAGSAHCLAMCGGLVAILVGGGRRAGRRLVAYNAGRVSMLAALGGVAGAAGTAVLAWAPVALAERALAVGAGAAIVVAALEVLGVGSGWGQGIAARLQRMLSRGVAALPRASSTPAALGLGALNAFLPCHLIYAFAAIAAGTGSIARGYLVMLAFGLGTVPAMVAPGLVRGALPGTASLRMQRAAGVLVLAVGLVTIARGIGVGPAHHVH